MTEKRFTITGDRSISDHHKKRLYDLSDFDGVISVTECLNELHEEKGELKQSFKEILKDLEVSTFNKELLEKENEELKSELKALRKKYNDFSDMVDKRLKEMDMGLVK